MRNERRKSSTFCNTEFERNHSLFYVLVYTSVSLIEKYRSVLSFALTVVYKENMNKDFF
jgi:hypothetical protein